MDIKEFLAEKLKDNNLHEIYCLEYSEHSASNGLFPWHIGTLDDAINHNIQDMFYNNRGLNKWQVVFAGSASDCDHMMKAFIKNKKLHEKKYRENKKAAQQGRAVDAPQAGA